MAALSRFPVQVFDRAQDYAVIERRLPHWSQAGTLAFITWRTWDSIPEHVLNSWLRERDEWLRAHEIDPLSTWRLQLDRLDAKARHHVQKLVSDRWNEHLDNCHGRCILRQPELSQVVEQSLLHFDGERYELTDFVVMPNHVHLIAAFVDEQSMLLQCESWKHFTATHLNRALNRRGRFWQQDGFDHLIRSVEQFQFLRQYIADNPKRARLRQGEFIHGSKHL